MQDLLSTKQTGISKCADHRHPLRAEQHLDLCQRVRSREGLPPREGRRNKVISLEVNFMEGALGADAKKDFIALSDRRRRQAGRHFPATASARLRLDPGCPELQLGYVRQAGHSGWVAHPPLDAKPV